MLSFCWSKGLDDFKDASFIRKSVFIEEQGFTSEFDQTDKTCLHVTGYLKGNPVAVGRLFTETPGEYHAGRIAVMKPYRGRNYGAELMREIIRKSRELGAEKVVLAAQKRAEGFYKTLGFASYGEEFLDEGCPHVNMELILTKTD